LKETPASSSPSSSPFPVLLRDFYDLRLENPKDVAIFFESMLEDRDIQYN